MEFEAASLERVIHANTPLAVEELKAAWPDLTLEQKTTAIRVPSEEQRRLRYLYCRILALALNDASEWIRSIAITQIKKYRLEIKTESTNKADVPSLTKSLREEIAGRTEEFWIRNSEMFCHLSMLDRLRVIDLTAGRSPLAIHNFLAHLLHNSTIELNQVDEEVRDILVQAVPALQRKSEEHNKSSILGWSVEMAILWRIVPRLPEQSRSFACQHLPIAESRRDDSSIPLEVAESLKGFDLFHVLTRDDV